MRLKGFINVYLSILVIPFAEAASDPNRQLPLWTWECVNERCVPIRATDLTKLQSLTTCNMLCSLVQIWPHPTGAVDLSSTAVPVRADLFQMRIASVPSERMHQTLKETFNIFREDLRHLELEANGFTEWYGVEVQISLNGSSEIGMKLDTDESYSLQLQPKTDSKGSLVSVIKANSFCGIVRGLETLLQLVWLDPYIGSLLILEAAKVEDAPHFGYRGLMLDTVGRFYPLSNLILLIDAMAANKMNTFHWHIANSQTCSLKFQSVQKFSKYVHGPNSLYSSDDVKTLVQRAKLRGIRVIIEIDLPLHMGSIRNWDPNSNISNCEETDAYCVESLCTYLDFDPKKSYTGEILETMYRELLQLTGVDDLFHIGGSEISKKCWEEQNSSSLELWLGSTREALKRLESANGKLPTLTLMWSSPLSEYLKTDLTDYVDKIGLQSRSAEEFQTHVSGIRTISSHEDAWDFNDGMGKWYKDAKEVPYNSWQRIYEHKPWSKGGLRWVDGGEGTIWSDTLSPGGLQGHVWPRAAALAERLWSNRPEGATRIVTARLDTHRSRMVFRGFEAAPLWSMWCTHNTYTCG